MVLERKIKMGNVKMDANRERCKHILIRKAYLLYGAKKQALLKAQVFSVKEHRPSLIQTSWKGSLGFAGREGSVQVAERASGKLYWP